MSNERFGIGAAHNRVKHRRFNLKKTVVLKIMADSRSNPAAFFKNFTAVVIHDKIDITLTIACFNVGQAVKLFGKRLQRLGNDVKLFGGNRQFSARCAADIAADADDIADVQIFQAGQFFFRQMVFMAKSLYFAAFILNVDKHAAVADSHGSAGNRYAVFGVGTSFKVFIFFLQISRKSRRLKTIRIRIVTALLQSTQFGQAGLTVNIGLFAHIKISISSILKSSKHYIHKHSFFQ